MPFLSQGKTNWKFITIIIVLAILVGGGILGYLRYFEREMVSLTKFPEIKKPEKIVEEETANWKTYKNKDLLFEVKYPEGWLVENRGDRVNFGEKKMVEVEYTKGVFKKVPLFEAGFTVVVYPNFSAFTEEVDQLAKGAASLEEWTKRVSQKLDKDKGEGIEPITFGLNNYRGFLIRTWKEIGVPQLRREVIAQRNGEIYFIERRVLTAQSAEFRKYDYNEIFNQMLSTFRFLE